MAWEPLKIVLRLALGFMILASCVAPAAAHEKTDVVVLKNGDRFTGEIKGVAQETLELDTDAAGTIKLEFDTLTNVTNTPRFRAQLNFSLTWEIVNNFNLGITLLDSYDTQPPTVESEKNEMSLSLSVGYTY